MSALLCSTIACALPALASGQCSFKEFQVSTTTGFGEVPQYVFGGSIAVVEEPSFGLNPPSANSLLFLWDCGNVATCNQPGFGACFCPGYTRLRRWIANPSASCGSFLDTPEILIPNPGGCDWGSVAAIRRSPTTNFKIAWNFDGFGCWQWIEDGPLLYTLGGIGFSPTPRLLPGAEETFHPSLSYSANDWIVTASLDAPPAPRQIGYNISDAVTGVVSGSDIPQHVMACTTADKNDTFPVAWPSTRGAVLAARVSQAGVFQVPIRIGRFSGDEDNPLDDILGASVGVAAFDDGSFVVAWRHPGPNPSAEIQFRRFNANQTPGSIDGSPRTTPSLSPGANRLTVLASGPSVLHASSRIVIVWQETVASKAVLKYTVLDSALNELVAGANVTSPFSHAENERIAHPALHPAVLRPDGTLAVLWQETDGTAGSPHSPGHLFTTIRAIP